MLHALATVATDLEPIRAPARIGLINRDAPIMTTFDNSPRVTLKQQALRLHHTVDAFDVHRRRIGLLPLAAQECMDAAVAIGRQVNLSQDRVRLRPGAAGFSLARLNCEVRPCNTKRIRHGLHGVPSRSNDGERNSRFFWLCQVQRLTQDLVLQRLLAEPPTSDDVAPT